MFNDNCNDCDDCLGTCDRREEFVAFQKESGLTQERFAEVVSTRLTLLAEEPVVADAQVLFFKGGLAVVADALGSFGDELDKARFLDAMNGGWLVLKPEALLWYAEAWSSDSEAVLAGTMRARDCPERYEVIAANAYHVASGWRLHVEMRISEEGVEREVVAARELDVYDEVGLRIMGRLDSGQGSGLIH